MSYVSSFRINSWRSAKRRKDFLFGKCRMIYNNEGKCILESEFFVFHSYLIAYLIYFLTSDY